MSFCPPTPISPTWDFLTESKQGITLTATAQTEAQGGHPSRTEACRKGAKSVLSHQWKSVTFNWVDSSPTPWRLQRKLHSLRRRMSDFLERVYDQIFHQYSDFTLKRLPHSSIKIYMETTEQLSEQDLGEGLGSETRGVVRSGTSGKAKYRGYL